MKIRNKGYLFESANEAKRLKIKTDKDELKRDFFKLGITKLKNNCVIADAGAGVGIASRVMADMLNKKGIKHRIILLDKSKERLNEAKNVMKGGSANVYEFKDCELTNIPIKSSSVDYIFCRFVFEYLSDPLAVYNEFYRILKPGGKMVVGDLDMNCMNIYPLPEKIEKILKNIAVELNRKNMFDINVGRKLYSYFYRYNMKKIKVHVSGHNIFFGNIGESNLYNWRAKIDQFIYLQEKSKLNLGYDLKKYKTELYKLMTDPSRFSYTPLIIVEGIK